MFDGLGVRAPQLRNLLFIKIIKILYDLVISLVLFWGGVPDFIHLTREHNG